MKKLLTVVLAVAVLLTLPFGAFAAYTDVPATSSYSDSVSRVTSLGLIDDTGNGKYNPNSAMTREQFAKTIVIAAGLEDMALTMNGPTAFSDLPGNGANNGYINEAVAKGYLAGKADGKFHSGDGVTYEQALTAMVKVLGYTNEDVPGTWPQSYIQKAKALGLTTGISLKTGDIVPRWAMAVLLDNLLDTNVKKVNSADTDKTLAEASSLTSSSMYTVYSKPEVYNSGKVINSKLGSIDISGNLSVVKNTVDNSTDPITVKTGEAISANQIKNQDVVYQVSNKSGKNKYILVIDNKVTGIITGIMPDKYTPKQVQVDNTTFELDKSFNTGKLSNTTGSYKIDDNVVLLLGYDGKVVDIQYSASDNSNFAFVMNYTSYTSNSSTSYGFEKYTVKMLMSNGKSNTFDTNTDPLEFKGKLVIYKKLADGSISLTGLLYSTPGEVNIRKDERQLLSNNNNSINYITDNVKVFNFISNEDGTDALAQVVSWSDVPSGVVQSGKILFFNKTGNFEDINMILLNNATSADYKLGIVKSVRSSNSGEPTFNYTILIEGKDYVYSNKSTVLGLSAGSVVKVNLVNNTIENILEVKYPDTQSTMIQAIDSSRIRVNSITYNFDAKKIIYLLDSAGNVRSIDTTQLGTNRLYDQVAVYTNIPAASGGKVEMMVVKNMF